MAPSDFYVFVPYEFVSLKNRNLVPLFEDKNSDLASVSIWNLKKFGDLKFKLSIFLNVQLFVLT